MDAIKTFDFQDGRKLEIIPDDFPESPREWDNLGTFAAFHKRYDLGDKNHGINHSDFNGWNEMEEYIRETLDGVVILPVYMYDHSGLAFSTSQTYPFDCLWDAGQVGFIFVTKAKIIEEYGKDSDETRQKVHTYLNGEIKTYNQWSNGNVYGFVMREPPCDGPGDEGYSCWGFYGSDPTENGMMDHLDEKYQEELMALVMKNAWSGYTH